MCDDTVQEIMAKGMTSRKHVQEKTQIWDLTSATGSSIIYNKSLNE